MENGGLPTYTRILKRVYVYMSNLQNSKSSLQTLLDASGSIIPKQFIDIMNLEMAENITTLGVTVVTF